MYTWADAIAQPHHRSDRLVGLSVKYGFLVDCPTTPSAFGLSTRGLGKRCGIMAYQVIRCEIGSSESYLIEHSLSCMRCGSSPSTSRLRPFVVAFVSSSLIFRDQGIFEYTSRDIRPLPQAVRVLRKDASPELHRQFECHRFQLR